MTKLPLYVVMSCCCCVAGCSGHLEPADEVVGESLQALTGTFTYMNLPSEMGDAPGNIELLTDGTVLASGPNWSNQWYTLAPSLSGRYVDGVWSYSSTSILGRWANPSSILRDGRYWEAGGEYTANGPINKSNRNRAEVFDQGTWSALPDDPFQTVGDPVKSGLEDAPTTLLADGLRILAGPTRYDNSIKVFDSSSSTWTPAANAPSGQSCEGGSILLSDGRVLSGSSRFSIYDPETNTWVRTQDTTPVSNAFAVNGELGPMLMLHDGRVLVLGANSHNGLYDPNSDTWVMAADTPGGLGHSDTAAAVEGSGRVLAVSTDATNGTGSSILHEYNPSSDTWEAVPGAPSLGAANLVKMLALPAPNTSAGVGQIMITGAGGKAWFYTPSTVVASGYRPSLTSAWVAFGKFHVSGIQLNGVTNGADVGDDAKMSTNYPIAWLEDVNDVEQHPYFARTFDFDTMALRHNTSGTFSFTIREPYTNWANGSWRLYVAASGTEALDPLDLTITGNRGWGLLPVVFN